MPLVFKGAVLGFLIAAPVGPIGLLCIARTLRFGWSVGLCSGLGAATADAGYAAIAAFGMKPAIATFIAMQAPVHVFGAGFLCYLGVKALRSRPSSPVTLPASVMGRRGAYGSTLLLTLANPATIVSFLALFAGTLRAVDLSAAGASQLTLGVFTGSALWWLSLASSFTLARRRIGAALTDRINAVAGVFLIAFGVATLASALRHHS